MSDIKVSKVSLASCYVAAVWFDYQQALMFSMILESTADEPGRLVEFMATFIAALEERDVY